MSRSASDEPWRCVASVARRALDSRSWATCRAQERESRARRATEATQRQGSSLADLLMRAREGELPTLNLIVKADVQGSLGAIEEALGKLPQSEVRVSILHGGVG